MSGASYVCPACGGLVLEARRSAHDEFWCQTSTEDDDDDDCSGEIPLELLRLTSSLYEDEVKCTFSFCPDHPLRVEQRTPAKENAEHETGGQLWWSELVLAEYLALSRRAPPQECGGHHASPESEARCRGVALGLGCGAAPVSCLAAAALGWDVLCTDLEEVLPLTRQNVFSSQEVVDAACTALKDVSSGCPGQIQVASLPFGMEPLPKEVTAWAARVRGLQLILCSDCIWESHRHRPLASTLAELLSPSFAAPGCEALVAYQRRQMDEDAFFSILPRFGLAHEPLDVTSAVRLTNLPNQLKEESRRLGTDPADWFCIHRVYRRTFEASLSEATPVEALVAPAA